MALESIGRGSIRPQRVIVWLGNEFAVAPLPIRLQRLRKRGVEFRFVDDVGPHGKYFYASPIAQQCGVPLVTIDDDVIYPKWWLENLMLAHRSWPNWIICYRARVMLFDQNGVLRPYCEWQYLLTGQTSSATFFTGVSGVAYPSAFLEIMSKAGTEFVLKCPKADDVWLNFLAAKNSFPVRQVFSQSVDFSIAPMTQTSALWESNQAGGNDEQIAQTYDRSTLDQLRMRIGA